MVCNPDVALRGANGYGTPDQDWRQPVSFVPATQKSAHRGGEKRGLLM